MDTKLVGSHTHRRGSRSRTRQESARCLCEKIQRRPVQTPALAARRLPERTRRLPNYRRGLVVRPMDRPRRSEFAAVGSLNIHTRILFWAARHPSHINDALREVKTVDHPRHSTDYKTPLAVPGFANVPV